MTGVLGGHGQRVGEVHEQVAVAVDLEGGRDVGGPVGSRWRVACRVGQNLELGHVFRDRPAGRLVIAGGEPVRWPDAPGAGQEVPPTTRLPAR